MATPAKTRVLPAIPTYTPTPLVTDTPEPSPTATFSPMPLPTATVPSPGPALTATSIPLPPTVIPTVLPPTESPAPAPTDTPPAQAPTDMPPTARPPTATATQAARPPLPPQQGGEWDMEAGFVPGVSPLGEDCPGWAVAVGWQAFLSPGVPASSCLNENKNVANIHSGERSQEITFDFISAEAGILRQAKTVSGHRYQIEAWGKHVRSQSPVELMLGVDLTGGENWQAASVSWTPWDETEEEVWVHTQLVVKATGETLTVFLKGYHPFAAQGGATLFDDVRVVDLGN